MLVENNRDQVKGGETVAVLDGDFLDRAEVEHVRNRERALPALACFAALGLLLRRREKHESVVYRMCSDVFIFGRGMRSAAVSVIAMYGSSEY